MSNIDLSALLDGVLDDQRYRILRRTQHYQRKKTQSADDLIAAAQAFDDAYGVSQVDAQWVDREVTLRIIGYDSICVECYCIRYVRKICLLFG